MSLKVYAYKNCGTCKKALRFLDEHGVAYNEVPIREQPPSKAELKRMLTYVDGALRKLFNTSGADYKTLGLKDKLGDLSESQAIDLLASNGNLVRRPFVLGSGTGTVGFEEAVWKRLFLGGS